MSSSGGRSIRAILAIAATSLGFSGCSGPDRDLPEPYRDVAVPEATLASAQARAEGRRLFLEHCALCHGENADGRGVRREGLTGPPRDFSDSDWRRRTTPRHVFHAIREGVPGTSMPAWRSLEDREAWELTAYLLSVAEKR